MGRFSWTVSLAVVSMWIAVPSDSWAEDPPPNIRTITVSAEATVTALADVVNMRIALVATDVLADEAAARVRLNADRLTNALLALGVAKETIERSNESVRQSATDSRLEQQQRVGHRRRLDPGRAERCAELRLARRRADLRGGRLGGGPGRGRRDQR